MINGAIFVFADSGDFQTLLRGTFREVFQSKGYHLKDTNISYKTNTYLIPKYNFLCSKNVAEKSFTT